jgi:hypothetical protein
MVRIPAFIFSFTTHIPTYRKVPWRLSTTRKANVRDRLKKVDAVIEAVRASGVECTALVCPPSNYYIPESHTCVDQRPCLAKRA